MENRVYDFSKFISTLNVSILTLLFAAGDKLASFSEPSWLLSTVTLMLTCCLALSLYGAYLLVFRSERLGRKAIELSSLATFSVITSTALKVSQFS